MNPDVPPSPRPGLWRRLLWWAPLLLMAGLIFLASSDLGAMSHQSRIIGPILAALGFSPETIIKIIVFIRKNAHMGEYALFAVLAWRGWHARPVLWRRAAWRWWPDALVPLGLAVAWASLDEFHQSFVPSRTASVGDVCWDTAGALIGLGVLWLWHRGGRAPEPTAPGLDATAAGAKI